MKILKILIPLFIALLAITSCKKQKQNVVISFSENNEIDKVLSEFNTPKSVEEITPVQTVENEVHDESFNIIPGKNGQPDEVDIASEHKVKIENMYYFDRSPDGKYHIYGIDEYYYTYDRYYMPIKGERKELNLIMTKEETSLIDPNDMGSNEKMICYPGCEYIPIARSKEPIFYKGQISYWFRVTKESWIPGASVYIQTGTFEKLPVEDLEIGMDYEKIKGGAWFIVKTDDGASLRLRDSSNIKTSNIIMSFPQGTWLYADAQTIDTDTIDGIESRWYKLAYPEEGYVFGGYLEKQDGVCGLEFASFAVSYYTHDPSKDYMFKVYSAPTVESEYLGEYEIKPNGSSYSTIIESDRRETIDGVKGVWIYITTPIKGFIFGDKFIYN